MGKSRNIIKYEQNKELFYNPYLFSSSVTLLESAAPLPKGMYGFLVRPWTWISPSGNIPENKKNFYFVFVLFNLFSFHFEKFVY